MKMSTLLRCWDEYQLVWADTTTVFIKMTEWDGVKLSRIYFLMLNKTSVIAELQLH